MASIIIRYQRISKIGVSPLAPHRGRFAPQNRLFESADCTGTGDSIDPDVLPILSCIFHSCSTTCTGIPSQSLGR